MKTFILILIFTSFVKSQPTRVDLDFEIFSNTASSIYPSIDYSSGDTATLSLFFDHTTSPIFSGMVNLDSMGNAIFDPAGRNLLSYDETVPPSSWMSNDSEYLIPSMATLRIADEIWTASSYKWVINNDFPTFTTTDAYYLDFLFSPPDPFTETLHTAQLSLTSDSSINSFLTNTALPTELNQPNWSDIDNVNFTLNPDNASWVINSGALTGASVQNIPEPSFIMMSLIGGFSLLIKRKRR